MADGCASSDRVPVQPVGRSRASLISHDKLIYPIEMAHASIQGWVIVDCDIVADDITHDCRIARGSNAGHDRAAMAFARICMFRAVPPASLPIGHSA